MDLGASDLDGPSVLPPDGPRTDWIMAARLVLAGEPARIVLFRSADGMTDWNLAFLTGLPDESPLDASTVHVPTTLSSVAHDDVASPSLLFRNGGYQLFYAGRTLGRWSVGAMMSDTLALWRSTPSPTVLAGTSSTAFDSYGVMDPAISTVDGDERRVELLYAGTNGAAYGLGRAERSATIVWATTHGLTPP
jgi:hypothetical protein